MMIKTETNSRAAVTVRRTDGTVETVETKHIWITDALFGRMATATKAAGRGELLSYTNPEVEAEELRCHRCNTAVDESAYSQTEQMWFGGGPVKATTHYCAPCARTLKAMGEMQERAR